MAKVRGSWAVVSSPLGAFGIVGDDDAVTEVLLPGSVLSFPAPAVPPEPVAMAAAQLEEYLAGRRTSFDVPLRSSGTDFQESVWKAILDIGSGQIESYGWVADRINRPKAARPVGQALGANPIPIFRPCHRVVAAEGLGGYGGDAGLKRALLAIEGVTDPRSMAH